VCSLGYLGPITVETLDVLEPGRGDGGAGPVGFRGAVHDQAQVGAVSGGDPQCVQDV
jgi:hypothetical protein